MEMASKSKIIVLEFMVFFLILMSSSMKSPLPFCLLLIVISGLIAIISGYTVSKWIFCTIFLIFLGGMMVMFLYVCSLSMNEKLILSLNPLPYLFVMLIIGATPLLSISVKKESLWEIFHYSWSPVIFFFIFYLLMSLVLAVKFAQSFKGALSKMW